MLIVIWLTGYNQGELETQFGNKTDFQTFFAEDSQMNLSRVLIKGVICSGVRVEDIENPTLQESPYLDKLVDG